MNKSVLVISNFQIFFIEDDIRIISEFAETRFWNTAEKGLINFSLIREIWSCDFIYCWFASAHSFFPALVSRLFNKKLIVVSGAYDTVYVPEIGYGHAGHPVKKPVSRTILSLADRVIVNSNHSKKSICKFLPSVTSKVDVVYHRIDYKEPDSKTQRDEKLILTVLRMNKMNYLRKKVDLIKEVARKLPDYRFVHIGHILDDSRELFHRDLPDNFETAGFVSDSELWNWYHKAGFLIAPSWHEGFGLTSVEALTAGCIPLVSGVGAQNEVTLGYAHEISSDEAVQWASEIQTLTFSEEERGKVKNEVRNSYPKSDRPKHIFRVFKELDESFNQ